MKTNNEIWKDIEGYPKYKISNLGRVMSYCHDKVNGRVLKPDRNTNGYCQVRLQKNKSKKALLIHRLLGNAFIPNVDNKPQINHKNGVKSDNRLENIEWCSGSENRVHAFKTGLQVASGEFNNCASLNWNIVRSIREEYNMTLITQTQLAMRYDVDPSTVSYIISNRSWFDPNYVRTRFGRRK